MQRARNATAPPTMLYFATRLAAFSTAVHFLYGQRSTLPFQLRTRIMSRLPAAQPLSLLMGTGGTPASNDGAIDNPCLSCGACCAHFRVSFYWGEIATQDGAGMVPPELVVQVGPLRAAMKGTETGRGRCIALKGEVGCDNVHCSIYENRPSPCREFEPWLANGQPEPDCQRVRARFGLPPLPRLPQDDVDPPAHAA